MNNLGKAIVRTVSIVIVLSIATVLAIRMNQFWPMLLACGVCGLIFFKPLYDVVKLNRSVGRLEGKLNQLETP